MTEEQMDSTNTQVTSEQEVDSQQQSEETSGVAQTTESAPASSNPQSKESEATQPIQPGKTVSGEDKVTQSPEKPRFFTGVMFFLGLFSTLVFFSVTAGYIISNR